MWRCRSMECCTWGSWTRLRYVQNQIPDRLLCCADILWSQMPFCFQASYGVEDPEYAVTQLAQTTMRSELGKLTLDKVFRVTSASSDLWILVMGTASDVWMFSKGKRVPELQHRPLHQPGFRRVGDPLPPVRNQRHPRSASRQGVHADAGESSRIRMEIERLLWIVAV